MRFDAEDFLNFLSFLSFFFFLSASGVSSALFDLGSNACLSFDPALRLTAVSYTHLTLPTKA